MDTQIAGEDFGSALGSTESEYEEEIIPLETKIEDQWEEKLEPPEIETSGL